MVNEKDSAAQYERVPTTDARLPSSKEMGPQAEEPPSKVMVFGSVSFYVVAALVMVLVNKAVLNAVQVPLFFLFCQLIIAVVLLQACAVVGLFNLPRIQLSVAKQISPLIGINCTGLIFNTYCLQYVDASFYQVARGLVLPFTVFFSYILLSQKSSKPVLGATLVVCLGFFCGISTDHLHTSSLGTVLGVLSSVTTSVHAIVIKKSLKAVNNTLDLVYLNNVLSAIVLAPLVLFAGESGVILDMLAVGGEQLRTFVIGTAVTGLFGFLICVAGMLSIKVTSPVTHMISAAVRGVIQTFMGVWFFGDVITSGRATGIGFILGGSIWYTWAKSQEGKAAAEPAVQLQNSPRSVAMHPGASASSASSRGGSPSISYSHQGDDAPQHRRGSTIAFGEKLPYGNNSLAMSRGPSGQTYVDFATETEKDQLSIQMSPASMSEEWKPKEH